ncbi:hypothetical protein V3C99_007924 [Haemonchus contortus]|uniref:Transposase n=1 Tax=Haemonchus contortus TaxID=6289 RepID=A0A7I5EB58_HAECO
MDYFYDPYEPVESPDSAESVTTEGTEHRSGESSRGAAIHPFPEREIHLILERYVNNYEIFHHVSVGGSRIGLPAKRRSISRLTEDINAKGVAKRTEKQIEQKIRDEIKILERYGTALASKMGKTGGGRMVTLPRLTAGQKRAFEAIEERPRVSGVQSGLEVGQNPTMESTCTEEMAAQPLTSAQPQQRRAHSKEEMLTIKVDNSALKKELLQKKLLLADLLNQYA